LNPLDRPIWASLTTDHAGLAEGGELALRYRPEVNVFASPADDRPEALAAFAALVPPEGPAYLAQSAPIETPQGLVAVQRAVAVQMLFEGQAGDPVEDADIVPLGEADGPEMFALATLTEPGPFRSETWRMGQFFGIRREGRLAAMAGERFRFPGHAELSGVCTHPDFRGQGFGRRLSTHVTRAIAARGERPFLHAWKDNSSAIALYERLGYRWRCDINVAVFIRA